MKKIVVVAALVVSFLAPVQVHAAETKFTGAPLTNLESQGATINIMLLGVPARGGLYIQECVEAAAGAPIYLQQRSSAMDFKCSWCILSAHRCH